MVELNTWSRDFIIVSCEFHRVALAICNFKSSSKSSLAFVEWCTWLTSLVIFPSTCFTWSALFRPSLTTNCIWCERNRDNGSAKSQAPLQVPLIEVNHHLLHLHCHPHLLVPFSYYWRCLQSGIFIGQDAVDVQLMYRLQCGVQSTVCNWDVSWKA